VSLAGIDCEVGSRVVVSLGGKGVIQRKGHVAYCVGDLSHSGEADDAFDGEVGLVGQLASEIVGA